MDHDGIKSVVEGVNVDHYLENELRHSFLGKDALSIDIDLSDTKPNLPYDPILQELQNEKLLEACGKVDEFMLPEIQFDHLDPLTLPDDMLVAGEILPSASIQSVLHVPNDDEAKAIKYADEASGLLDKSTEPLDKSTQIFIDDIQPTLEDIDQDSHKQYKAQIDEDSLTKQTQFYIDELVNNSVVHSLHNVPIEDSVDRPILEKLKKTKIRLEPRIIKKNKKHSVKLSVEPKCVEEKKENSKDGIMAVVAISTDKISNLTQIVINNGKEEQIYQGKTSELIEATGNFPKLPKLNSGSWAGTVDYSTDNSTNSQHDLIVTNALEELGVTDDNLQPVSVNELGKVWMCPKEDCNRQFNRMNALKGHLLSHYGVKPFKCDYEGCAWAFYSEFKLKRHKETHLKRKDFVCEVDGCNRRFTTIYNLWSHEKLHSRPNRIICQVPECHEKFQTKRALELHMKSHDQSHAPYVCKQEGCGKRYYSSNALTSHQRCHSYKEIDVKCSWPGCGKVFDKPCRLKAHLRSHTGCKPYPCTFQGCQWAFSSSSKLKRHQKKHTNDRKFVCDVPSCGKAFMRSEHLKEHRLTHEDDKYFHCYMCDASFSAKSSLYVHVKKHHIKHMEVNLQDLSNVQNHTPMPDPHCSRVNPIVKVNKKFDIEVNSQVTGILNDSLTNDSDSKNERLDYAVLNTDQKTFYHCPMESCTKSYRTKASLNKHTLKVHRTTFDNDDKLLERLSSNSDSNMDYILYTPSSTIDSSEQMIMMAPCDTVILSSPTDTDSCLPEPEPPPMQSLLKVTQPLTQKFLENEIKRDQGSARTCLTISDFRKMKSNGAILDSVAGASDVVLGTGDLGEGLLLSEELCPTYYQDDVVGAEYQVFFLDSETSENTINLMES